MHQQLNYMDSGMIRIIKNGGSLKAHTANDPPEGWLKFTQLVEQSAFYALGWRREMLDSSAVGGAGVRGFSADINKSIAARRETLESGYKRIAQYIIAKRAKMGAYNYRQTGGKYPSPSRQNLPLTRAECARQILKTYAPASLQQQTSPSAEATITMM